MAAPVVIYFAVAFTGLVMAGVDAQGAERRRTGNVCTVDSNCPDNAFCRQSAYCVCKDGYIFVAVSGTSKACLRVAEVGDPCEKHIQCHTMMGLHAECVDGACACKPGTKLIGGRCYQIGAIGQRCIINENCFLASAENDTDRQGFCVRGLCTCQLRYSPRDNGTSDPSSFLRMFGLSGSIMDCTAAGRCTHPERLAVIGQPCIVNENCFLVTAENDTDRQGFCVRGLCTCQMRYSPRDNGTRCVEDAMLNDTCEDDEQCAGVGFECRGTCLCKQGFAGHNETGGCLKTVEKLNDTCEYDVQCQSLVGEGTRLDAALCLSGKCSCAFNARDAGGKCWVTRRPGQSCHRDEECISEEDEPGYCLNGVCTCKTCVPDARDFGGSAAISASLTLSAILITAAILV